MLAFSMATHAFAQNQHEMNLQAQQAFAKADAQLNKVYQKLLVTLDDESKAKLKTAQKNWIVFRDTEADFHADNEARGGSLAPLIYSSTQTDLTKERTAALKKLLETDN